MSLDDEQREALRNKLSALGRQVNDGIIAMQGRKPMPQGINIPVTIDVSDPPEVRLKTFLNVIQGRMKLLREGSEVYGKCAKCSEPIDYSALDYEPWLDKHPHCVSDE
jgi:RNA polymerase-binding transcription factor DksA